MQPVIDGAVVSAIDPADKLAVAETVYRYATAVDRRDWALYRSLFADTVSVDFSSYSPDQPRRVTSADDWVAGLVPLFTGLASTQHSMTSPLATVDGDAATITMYTRAHHIHDPDDPAIMERARAAGKRILGR